MTEQPQQEYIITEEELENLNTREKPNPDCADGLDHGSKRIGLANWERKQIVDRVRSRKPPAPAAPPNICPGCNQIDVADRVLWLQEHDATIRKQEREWWMLRVKAILQKTKYYDELDTALHELLQEAMDESQQHGGERR